MRDTTAQIEWDRLYSPSQIARPSELNPSGLGLLDLCYSTVLRKVKKQELRSVQMGTGGRYTRYVVRGGTLIEYLNRGYKNDNNEGGK